MKIYTTEEITKKLNRKKIIKNIFKAIIYPIIILVLICNIILLVQKIITPDKIATIFGYKAFVISSGSMEPTLNIGDIVIIKETKQEQISKGNIITFRKDGYNITHRINDIIEKDGEKYYQTKGDKNTTNDADLVKYEEIEGVYVFKIDKIGSIITYAQNTTTIIIIVCVIYLIYRISAEKDDRKIARHEKRKEYEKKNQNEKELKIYHL